MLYALGFIGLFTIGGLTGLFLAALAIDVHVHDTYFVVAHFHYIMVGGTVMAYLGGIHFWWPKMTGRMYPEVLGAAVGAALIFVGFNLTFFPQFVLGYLGMPRRYHAYPAEFQVLNVMSSAGASILGVGYLLPLIYLHLVAALRPDAAAANPWGAKGLEWQTESPPPAEQLPHAAGGGDEEPYDVRAREGGSSLSDAGHDRTDGNVHARRARRRSCHHFETWSSRRTPPRWACGCSLPRRSCSSAGCSGLRRVPRRSTGPRSPRPAATWTGCWAPSTPSC